MEIETKFFITNLKNARKDKKISLINLALSVGIAHSHLYYIESGKVLPSIDLAIKLAKAVGLDVRDMFVSPSVRIPQNRETHGIVATHSNPLRKDPLGNDG